MVLKLLHVWLWWFFVLHTSWFLWVLPLCVDYGTTTRLSVSSSIYMTIWNKLICKLLPQWIDFSTTRCYRTSHKVILPRTDSCCKILIFMVSYEAVLWQHVQMNVIHWFAAISFLMIFVQIFLIVVQYCLKHFFWKSVSLPSLFLQKGTG